ncbi:zinc finger protein 555, partial [Homo sapiens]
MLETFQNLASVDDETQFKASGSVSQQDIYGEKIPKESKIATFTRNVSWASVLGKIWDSLSIEDQTTNQGRNLSRNHGLERLCESNDQCGEALSQIPHLNLYKKIPPGVKQY